MCQTHWKYELISFIPHFGFFFSRCCLIQADCFTEVSTVFKQCTSMHCEDCGIEHSRYIPCDRKFTEIANNMLKLVSFTPAKESFNSVQPVIKVRNCRFWQTLSHQSILLPGRPDAYRQTDGLWDRQEINHQRVSVSHYPTRTQLEKYL